MGDETDGSVSNRHMMKLGKKKWNFCPPNIWKAFYWGRTQLLLIASRSVWPEPGLHCLSTGNKDRKWFYFFFSTLQAPLLSNTNISDLLYQKKLSGKQNSDPVVQQCYMDVSEKNITPYLLWRIFIARRLSSMSLQ